ncbi:hypothetical protein RKD19_000556 [Streptomyces canus]
MRGAKPSTHTITGKDNSSASQNACGCRSAASWWSRAYSWIQPESRWDMVSLWSFPALRGAPLAWLATVSTIGRPRREALYRGSTMCSRPGLAVAVQVRAPAAEAPTHVDNAANADSTSTYVQGFSDPDFTRRLSSSTSWVCGGTGQAAITSGRQRATAFATTRDPSVCFSTGRLPTQRVRHRVPAVANRQGRCRGGQDSGRDSAVYLEHWALLFLGPPMAWRPAPSNPFRLSEPDEAAPCVTRAGRRRPGTRRGARPRG